MSDYGPTEMSYPSDLIPGAPKHSERRAEILAKFARELATLIDEVAGTPEEQAPWVGWARRTEGEMLREVVRLRRMS
jgi:hypothetical protein